MKIEKMSLRAAGGVLALLFASSVSIAADLKTVGNRRSSFDDGARMLAFMKK